MQQIKICPDCRYEFVPEAMCCPDCGTALVWPSQLDEVPTADLREATWDFAEPREILGQIASDTEQVVSAYLAALTEEGIRAAVLPRTRYEPPGIARAPSVFYGVFLRPGRGEQAPVGGVVEGFEYMLFVRRDETERAEAAVERAWHRLFPDGDTRHREYELGVCPACGASAGEDADACPDCGLSLG